MIRVSVLAFGFALIALPALAEGMNFGTYTCRQQVPCHDDGTVPREQFTAYANQCMMTGFGDRTPHLFEDSGLDISGCLTTNKDAVVKGQGARLLPYCCVVQAQSGTCVMQCKLLQE